MRHARAPQGKQSSNAYALVMGDWDPAELIATQQAINRGRVDLLLKRGIDTEGEDNWLRLHG